jgi:DNA-binding transcriptional MerR regulator
VSIGHTLADARRQAGLTVANVSQGTRIREQIIRAIEQDDFSACGGDFYARGYIRSIAEVVGLDLAPLIRQYDTEHGPPSALRADDLFEPSTPIKIREQRSPRLSLNLGILRGLKAAILRWRTSSTPTGRENESTPNDDEGADTTPVDVTRGDTCAQSKRSRPLNAVIDGMARIFDFTGSLSRRTVTAGAEEDMALAWREVSSGLPPLRGRVPVSDQQPPTEEPTAFATVMVRRPQQEEQQPFRAVRPAQSIPFWGEEIGYRGPTACKAAGITYRQLDYWARTGLVEPSVRAAYGRGSQRLYGFRDILLLKVIKRLLDTGISLQQIRAAVHHLRDHGPDDLAQVTLMSDGTNVYECASPDEVVDLLTSGEGMFGIALGRVWQEVAGELAELPAVRAENGLPAVGAEDPLVRAG